jgi:ankyrin repeat protein
MYFGHVARYRRSIDLNIGDRHGWTPLHHAVKNGGLNCIEYLLDHDVDSTRFNQQNEAAIHLAVILNQLDALKVNCSDELDFYDE